MKAKHKVVVISVLSAVAVVAVWANWDKITSAFTSAASNVTKS